MYPLKLFGITVRSTMLSSIGVGLLSAIGTISASYYNKMWINIKNNNNNLKNVHK